MKLMDASSSSLLSGACLKTVNLGLGLNNEQSYTLTWVNKGRERFGSPWTIWVCADEENTKGG